MWLQVENDRQSSKRSGTIRKKRREIGRLYTKGRTIRLDELGQTFVTRLVIRL